VGATQIRTPAERAVVCAPCRAEGKAGGAAPPLEHHRPDHQNAAVEANGHEYG
jgi:hypothetical protein